MFRTCRRMPLGSSVTAVLTLGWALLGSARAQPIDPTPGADVAVLTGVGELAMDDGDRRALRAFVEDGGTLLVDAAGGDEGFATSARAMLREEFDVPALTPLGRDHPLMSMKGRSIEQVIVRRGALGVARKTRPTLLGLDVEGRTRVILSPRDLTGGLLGHPHDHVNGYTPDSAERIVGNVLRYVVGRSN